MTGKASIEDIRKLMRDKSGGQPEKGVAKAKLEDDGSIAIYESTLKELSDKVTESARIELKPAIINTIAKSTAEEVEALSKGLDTKFDKTHSELIKLAESTRVVEIKTERSVKKLDGIVHENFQSLLKAVNAGLPIMMVGPAGTGKTHSAELAASSLGLDFYSISVGSQTSKSDLTGYMNATGSYVATAFRRAYENGGVFLLDEADAGNSNVLILLNAALSNGYMSFPDKMVKAHEDFRLIASANTFGTGASRQYVGRNQLDAATLDRFTTIEWPIDDRIEASIAGNTKEGKKWLEVVRSVRRKAISEMEMRVVVSPRATQRGVALLKAGLPFTDVLKMALINSMPPKDQTALQSHAEAVWNKK